jgi:hypothetical protein
MLAGDTALAVRLLQLRRALARRILLLEARLAEQIQSVGLRESAWHHTERELVAAESALASLPGDLLP